MTTKTITTALMGSCLYLVLPGSAAIAQSDGADDQEQSQTQATRKIRARSFNPFLLGRSSRFSSNPFGFPSFGSFGSPLSGEGNEEAADEGDAAEEDESDGADAASPGITITGSSGSRSSQLAAGSSGRPPYRPPVRSPYRPPPRPPF